MKLIILTLLITGSIAAPLSQSLTFYDNGSYQFSYETGKEGGSHSRSESRNPDGVVVGKFSYEDPTGEIREVNYRADNTGYKAKGDVSVKGAPKGEFPVAAPEQHSDSPPPSTVQVEEQEPQEQQQEPQEPQEPQEAQETSADLQQEDSNDKEDIKDLTLEESTVDAPPEAFPAGFFLQHFQGLRRLPEPTKEEEPTQPEPTESSEAPAEEQAVDTETKDTTTQELPTETEPTVKGANGADFFVPLKPFPNFSPQQWASTMYHQPVYVFSYQQPDSFGYHYFF